MKGWGPYAALAGICFFWGTTYLGIRIGVEHFPPFLFSGIRYVISGLLVVGYFVIRKENHWPDRRELLNLIVSGTFIFTGGNLFLVLAEREVPSGLAALVNTSFPIWILIITRIWNPSERTPLLVLIGIIVAFAGQLMIFHEQLYTLKNIAFGSGLFFLIGGVINGSIGSVHMKKYKISINPVLTGGLQMLLGGTITTIIGLIRGELPLVTADRTGWYSMIYLIIAGSVIGYSLFVYALHYLPATLVSVYAYVNPVVALWLGWLILHETITTQTIYAMLITFTGVYIVNYGMRKANRITETS